MIAFSKIYNYLREINTELLGLSIDSNSSHLAWMNDIYLRTGIIIPFPIIADRSGEIARQYGMVSKDVSNTQTVRDVVIINPEGTIEVIFIYPINVGRNTSEIIRTIQALQMAECSKCAMPANWIPNQPVIEAMPQTYIELEERKKNIEENNNGMNWYLSFKNITPSCIEKN